MNGYSYTTISMEPGSMPRVAVSIYPDERATALYFPARGDSPACFLHVEHANVVAHIGLTADTTVTEAHVGFARELFNAAAGFLADCERLHAEHTEHAQATDSAA